jgi:hypothetical protein
MHDTERNENQNLGADDSLMHSLKILLKEVHCIYEKSEGNVCICQ